VKTEVKPAGENEVVLEIEVPRDDVRQRYERTLTRVARETQVPGFRKGRVPKAIVLQRLGHDYIRSETLNDALPEWYEQALDSSGVAAVSVPEVDFTGDFSEDADFAFTAKVQVRPTAVPGEYKGLAVPKRSAEVTDEQVDAQLTLLQERFASLKPVEERPVQHDDFVLIDLEGFTDGEPIEGAKAEDYMAQVGQGTLIPGFEENLTGIAIGEEKQFDLTFPTDYGAEELAGKPATFKVKVKEIKEKVVPELGDDFAKDSSEFETLDELRADIRQRLEATQAAEVEREFRAAVIDAVVQNASVTVPSAMIDRQAHNLYHELESTVGEQGMTMDVYLGALQKTAAEVEAELRPRAEFMVKRQLVLEAISAAEDIVVSDDELKERIKADAAGLERDPEQLISDVYAAGRQELIRDELQMIKTVDFLVAQAQAVAPTAAESDVADGDDVEVEADVDHTEAEADGDDVEAGAEGEAVESDESTEPAAAGEPAVEQ
jgi:trigger factor